MNRSIELSKQDIINVFKANFNFPIEDTPLGRGIKMPAREAFLFCNVTGAGYLDNYVYPFTPKGLMKLFYNAFDYNFVTGVFEKTTLKNTPYILSIAKPFLFDSQYKYIVPIEFYSDVELQQFLEERFSLIPKTTDFIVMRVEMSKKGHGLESFMEYLSGEYFKKKSFIVENQIPLAYSVGSPDFGGYDLPTITNAIKEYLPQGFHIIELSMLRLPLKSDNYDCKHISNVKLLVGEAKTSTKIMDKQLRKYMNTGLFDWGTEIHPNKQCSTKGDMGIFTLDSNYKIKFVPPINSYARQLPSTYSVNEYKIWLENYMKFYLLANLTNDELCLYYQNKVGRTISDQNSLAEFVMSLSIDEIINEIKKHI